MHVYNVVWSYPHISVPPSVSSQVQSYWFPPTPIFLSNFFSNKKITLHSVCATYTLLSVCPSTGTWSTYRDYTLKENWLSSYKLSTVASFLASGSRSINLPPSLLEGNWLIFCRQHSSCEIMIAGFLSCSEDTVSFWAFLSSVSLLPPFLRWGPTSCKLILGFHLKNFL